MTTLVASCGCPIPPEVASGEAESLGWHLEANHPEISESRVREHAGAVWVDCAQQSPNDTPRDASTVHRFTVGQFFDLHLTGPTHMLVCERCGMHLHADFQVAA